MAGVTIEPNSLAAPVRRHLMTPWAWLGVALGLAYIPHLVAYGANLMRLEHYQFFPLAWLGAVALIWLRRHEMMIEAAPNRPVVGWTSVVLGILLLTGAGILASSWLAMVSIPPMVVGFAGVAGGWSTVRAVGPALAMFVTTLRPPGSLDSALILRLRTVAVDISGRVLDAAGIIFAPLGNTIRVAGGDLFVDEACSGINSLASIVAVVLFVGLLLKRRTSHLVLLVGGSIGIVLLANVARISIVAVALDRYHVDLLHGWKHEGLGVAIYAVSLTLAASLDQLIFLIGSALPQRLFRLGLSQTSEVVASPGRASGRPPRHLMTCAVVLAAVALILPARWGRAALVSGLDETRVGPLIQHAQTILSETSLPAELAGWRRVGFGTEERSPDNPMGQYSTYWDYRLESRTVRLSIDYPFLGWHELLTCYDGLGWTTGPQALGRGLLDAGPEPAPYIGTTLENRRGEHGSLRFALVDDRGRWVTPASRAGLIVAGREMSWQAAPTRPTYQIQVFGGGFRLRGSKEEEQITHLFEAACRDLKARLFRSEVVKP